MSREAGHYIFGETRFLGRFRVGPRGYTYVVQDTGTNLDGITVEIPAGSVREPVAMWLAVDDGRLVLRSGTGSGVTVVLGSSEDVTEFEKPVIISATFDPALRPLTVVGYAIDPAGALRPVNTFTSQRSLGVVSFSTYRPLTLTWAYVFE